jgi:hypothetical protein
MEIDAARTAHACGGTIGAEWRLTGVLAPLSAADMHHGARLDPQTTAGRSPAINAILPF